MGHAYTARAQGAWWRNPVTSLIGTNSGQTKSYLEELTHIHHSRRNQRPMNRLPWRKLAEAADCKKKLKSFFWGPTVWGKDFSVWTRKRKEHKAWPGTPSGPLARRSISPSSGSLMVLVEVCARAQDEKSLSEHQVFFCFSSGSPHSRSTLT